jgi:hypothetical protein
VALVLHGLADMTTRIATMNAGYFDAIDDNETTLVSTKDDPPKHRRGVKWQEGWGRSLGADSFNHVRANGTEDEIVLLQGKMDDRYPFGPEAAGEYRWDIKAPGPNDDAHMIGVMNAFHDHIQFNVPISAPNLGGGGGIPAVLQSPNGRVQLVAQNDGNLVLYIDGAPVKAVFGLPPNMLW